MFIQTIVGAVGITKTITLAIGCLIRLVGVVGITKTLTVHWLFIKTITVPLGCYDYCKCGQYN